MKLALGERVRFLIQQRIRILLGLVTLAIPFAACCADVVSIWGGARGTVVRKSDGTVWTWGANFAGKLGAGAHSTNVVRFLCPSEVHAPREVSFLSSVTAIMAGDAPN